MRLAATELGAVEDIPEQRITAKISKLEYPSDCHAIVHLRTPRSKTLQFLAGQEVQLRFADGPACRLPLANCPCDGLRPQFHLRHIDDDPLSEVASQVNLDAVTFLRRAQGNLSKLGGLELAGERVSAIKCYLTGERLENGEFSIRRLRIKDKHGLIRTAFNAKVNIYRDSAEPILLGIEDKKLAQNQQPV